MSEGTDLACSMGTPDHFGVPPEIVPVELG